MRLLVLNQTLTPFGIIVRNDVEGSAQSNFYIVPGNHVGVIVQPTTTSTLINGNSGGGLGTTDPNANFAH